MKNKHLLKVFSMGALSSLLVTPLVLNGVSDNVQEEAIAQSVEDNHRSIKRSAVSDDIYSLENASTWANATYAKDNDDGKYWLHGFASNHSMEADLSKDLIRIAFKVKNGVDYTLKLGWGFNNIEENSGITVCGVPNITGSSNTWGQAKLASKNNGGFQTEFFGDEMVDEETYHFTGNSSGAYFLVINADLYEGFTSHLKTELIQDDVIDTQEPVVTASKYAISLPVKTSTRLTKEYLLNQKIFKVTDDTDGDITDRLVIKSGNINYDKTGTYPLVLSCTDNAGNESTLTFNVLIGDFEKPTYSIKQSTMYVKCPDKLSEVDLLNNVTFSDNYDTSITKTVVTNNYKQNTNCGTYSVTIRGTDTSGNYTDATFNVCVRDIIAPTITGITNTQVIKSANVRVSDSGSGIKSVTIDDKSVILVDGEFAFNASSYADGTHILKATDNQGNGTIIKFISDKSAPTITGIDSSTRLNKSVTITLADTYSNIVSFKLNGTLIEVNANTKQITLGADNLVQGTNKITELKDSLGNVASDLSFIYDTIAPVITPNVSGGGSIKSGDYITSEQVKAQFTATDEVDGSCAISVVSSTIEDKVGKYVVVLRSVDKTGNATEISVNVERLDVTAPVIFIKSSDDITIMKVASGTEITYENLLNIFMYLYQDKVNAQDCSIEVLSDGFVANGTESQVVRYMVTNNVTGDTTMYSLDYQSYVMASDDKKDDNKTDEDKKDDTNKDDSDKDNKKDDTKEENWFVRVFKGIGNFFKKIWNFVTGLFGGNKDTDVKTTDKVESSVTTPEVTTDPDIATDDNNNEAEYIVW